MAIPAITHALSGNSNANYQMKKAFSLIELSIVLLIIGILIAGITQSSRLINLFNLSIAQNLTLSSPINSTSGLSMWLEPTLDESLEDVQREDDMGISIWKDINPQTSNKISATQDDSTKRPLYIRSCLNNLPCLRFDGVDDYFDFDGRFLANSNFTIFVVESRRKAATGYFISGQDWAVNKVLHLGYEDDRRVKFLYGDPFYVEDAVPAYSSPVTRLHTIGFNYVNGKTYEINSQSIGDGSASTQPLESYEQATIGRFLSFDYYGGDIAEIVIFNKSLKASEIREIENYLAKKWKITLTQ